MRFRTQVSVVALSTIMGGIAWAGLPGIAAAQTASDQATQASPSDVHGNILQEVVITASRKRIENVQATPIAVTAVTSRMLERQHITNLTGIAQIAPNLSINQNQDTAATAVIFYRGFGAQTNDPAVDPHVPVFIDGIYNPQISGGLLDMFDIEQVEVQGGPQGTLLGKNASIGAIYITTKKPTGDFSGVVEGDYGSYNHFGARALVNFPIVPGILAGKVSFIEKEGGNWIKDLTTGKTDLGGENDKVANIALAFTPSDEFRWDLTGSVEFERDPEPGTHEVNSQGGYPGNPSQAIQVPTFFCGIPGLNASCAPIPYGTSLQAETDRSESDIVKFASNMSYRFEPVTLTSVTGVQNFWLNDNQDFGGAAFPAGQSRNDRTTYDFESEELRISSNKGGGWDLGGNLDWVIGGYFSNHHYYFDNILLVAGVVPSNDYERGTDQSEAWFAHGIYNFTDQFSFAFGVRQSYDQKTHSYSPGSPVQVATYYADVPIGFHNVSFEASPEYKFDANHMAYFRFAQGYQSGGYLGLPGCAGCGSHTQPETNNFFEVGSKNDWLNHRLRVNVDLFVNELDNLQVYGQLPNPAVATNPNAAPFLEATSNAGSATIEGMETQIVAVPVENLTTHLNLGYLHPKYDRYQFTTCNNTGALADCSGLPHAYSPKWTIDFGGDYVYDLPQDLGSLTFSADWNYRSSAYNDDGVTLVGFQNGYALVNAGLKYTDITGKYSLEFYGTNILNRHYIQSASDAGGLAIAVNDGRPAEWGMRVTAKF